MLAEAVIACLVQCQSFRGLLVGGLDFRRFRARRVRGFFRILTIQGLLNSGKGIFQAIGLNNIIHLILDTRIVD